jgi:hypothetical protein
MGLILAETLSGAPVIQLDGWWPCVLAHLRGELPIPREVQEGPLGPIIAKATSLDPALRYADAAQLQAALEGVCLRLFGGIPSPGDHPEHEEGQPSPAARPLPRVTTQPRAASPDAPTAPKPAALPPKPDALTAPSSREPTHVEPRPALTPAPRPSRRWLAAWVALAVGLSGCGCLGVSLFFSTDTLRAWLRERNTVTAQRADDGDESKEDSPKADEPPHKADKPPKKGKGKTPKAPPKPVFDARQAMIGTWQIREIDTLGIRQPGDGATLTITPATLSYRFYLDIENQPYTVTATTDKTVSFRVQEDDSPSDALFEFVNPDEAIHYADESKAYLKRLR